MSDEFTKPLDAALTEVRRHQTGPAYSAGRKADLELLVVLRTLNGRIEDLEQQVEDFKKGKTS